MKQALKEFDAALPALKQMRDVAEHFDDYATDDGRNKKVTRRDLEVGVIGAATFQCLDGSLDADVALTAARQLFKAMQEASAAANAGADSR
jgi:hypothetical protein